MICLQLIYACIIDYWYDPWIYAVVRDNNFRCKNSSFYFWNALNMDVDTTYFCCSHI